MSDSERRWLLADPTPPRFSSNSARRQPAPHLHTPSQTVDWQGASARRTEVILNSKITFSKWRQTSSVWRGSGGAGWEVERGSEAEALHRYSAALWP